MDNDATSPARRAVGLSKLDLRDRVQAIVFALRIGLVRLGVTARAE
jgi:hypothetical protein